MKKIIIAISIFAFLIGIGIAAIIINNTSNGKEDIEDQKPAYKVNNLSEISIGSNGIETGKLTGYTNEMDVSVQRDDLVVVLKDNRSIDISFDKGEINIDEITYELKGENGERLIDAGELDKFARGQKEYKAVVPVSEILEVNEEYLLVIKLKTKELGNVFYYSRVMVVEYDFVKEQMEFARKFSDSTLDEDKASDLVTYLEPNPELPNNNMGHITLENNYALLTWNNLSPKRTGTVSMEMKEAYIKDNGQSGTYELRYKVEAEGNNQITDVYDIIETITVWTFDEKQYVLAYDREMNQVWDVDKNTVRSSFIDLGIQNITEADFKYSKEGKYTTFVANNALWVVDNEQKQFVNVYSVDAYYSGKTKVLTSNIYDNGNVDFVVCGYSTEPAHIGKNGISVCRYNNESNSVEEVVFIPYNKPMPIMVSEVQNLCYMNDEVLYVMLGKSIHYVNIATKESGTISENLAEGTFAMNKEKNTFAYNTNGTLYSSNNITIMDLQNGKTSVIHAGKGNKISVCGYSGNNLVYGIAKEKNIKEKKNQFNMSSITILNRELEEIKNYKKKDILITNIEITDAVINLSRSSKGKPTEDDQLIDNTEEIVPLVKNSYYDDTKKLRELALSYEVSFNKNIESSTRDVPTKKIKAVEIEQHIIEAKDVLYYVYVGGELKAQFLEFKEAEEFAISTKGVITDVHGNKIWTFEDNY